MTIIPLIQPQSANGPTGGVLPSMQAVVSYEFGGAETLRLQTFPIAIAQPGQVLIKVQTAGIGKWDLSDREGMFVKMTGQEPVFPRILGAEGSGTIMGVGPDVKNWQVGDQVYGLALEPNPRRGFYAQYTALPAERIWKVPKGLSLEQAGVLPSDGGTALRGLEQLNLAKGSKLMIFGASGGIGHLALQLARRKGLQVMAVASGADGVRFCRTLGSNMTIDGHQQDILAVAREFAPEGLDGALMTFGGEKARQALKALKPGAPVVSPYGVMGLESPSPEIEIGFYNGNYDRPLLKRLNSLIESGPFEVRVSQTFGLDQVAEAHQALTEHYLGRLALCCD